MRKRAGARTQQRAAQIQVAGAQYKAAQSAKTMDFQADLTDWAAKTNQGFAMARAYWIKAEATVDIMETSTARAMCRAVGSCVAAGVA